MSRTSDIARHDFLPHSEPTPTRAGYLRRFLESGHDDRFEWIQVFCVIKGTVQWEGPWNDSTPPKRLRFLYGSDDLVPLGSQTGFLVRTFSQRRDYDPEELIEDQKESRENYHGLALFLMCCHEGL